MKKLADPPLGTPVFGRRATVSGGAGGATAKEIRTPRRWRLLLQVPDCRSFPSNFVSHLPPSLPLATERGGQGPGLRLDLPAVRIVVALVRVRLLSRLVATQLLLQHPADPRPRLQPQIQAHLSYRASSPGRFPMICVGMIVLASNRSGSLIVARLRLSSRHSPIAFMKS